MNQNQVKNEATYEINGVIYLVSTHFGEGEESILDKIGRLIRDEVNNADLTNV